MEMTIPNLTKNAPNPMNSLYRRLQNDIGINRAYVQENVLPDWWEDAAAQNATGYAEAIGIIARNLALDIHTLQGDGKIKYRLLGQVNFKHDADIDPSALDIAKSIALRVAELSAKCTVSDVQKTPSDPIEIRREILEQGVNWVDLSALVKYCWQHGIAVIPLTKFPSGAHKMDGLAANMNGRPVIVISKSQTQPAWLVFILAHELGHIVLGHTKKSIAFVDGSIQPSNNAQGDDDEDQANQFAQAVLTGNPFMRYTASRNLTVDQLEQAVRLSAEEHNVDPGVVALNYAWSKRFFATTAAVLKRLNPNVNGLALLRHEFCVHIDLSRLPEDSAHYLSHITDSA